MRPVHIRWMVRRDMGEVIDIEQRAFRSGWTEEQFLQTLRNRNCIGMVAEIRDKVVGFMVYELQKTRLDLLNLAVEPRLRRQGIGRQLVEKLLSKLSEHRRHTLTVPVRESNLDAQLFFRSQGLRAVHVLRRLYDDTGEDCYLMQFSVGGHGDVAVNRIAAYFDS